MIRITRFILIILNNPVILSNAFLELNTSRYVNCLAISIPRFTYRSVLCAYPSPQ